MMSKIQSADQRYFEYLSQNVFEIPKCGKCGKFHFFPRVLCPFCGSENLQWAAPTGFATVYSTTTVRRQEGDYNVSLIELEEGPRLMSRVEGIYPDEVRIGLKVRTHILQREDGPMLVFVKRENIEH